jgi:thiamine phosphate synthase YjbQ (UPF0047 family)
MTSVEVPYSIACALPTLMALDISNEVAREVERSGLVDGIAYVSPGGETALVRVSEREHGFFEDLETLLAQLAPVDMAERERLLVMLLGARTEQVPFAEGALCLGQWQRILLVTLDGAACDDWTVTLVG